PCSLLGMEQQAIQPAIPKWAAVQGSARKNERCRRHSQAGARDVLSPWFRVCGTRSASRPASPFGNAEAAGAGSAAKSSVSPRTIMPTEQLTYAAHAQANGQLEIMQPAAPPAG